MVAPRSRANLGAPLTRGARRPVARDVGVHHVARTSRMLREAATAPLPVGRPRRGRRPPRASLRRESTDSRRARCRVRPQCRAASLSGCARTPSYTRRLQLLRAPARRDGRRRRHAGRLRLRTTTVGPSGGVRGTPRASPRTGRGMRRSLRRSPIGGRETCLLYGSVAFRCELSPSDRTVRAPDNPGSHARHPWLAADRFTRLARPGIGPGTTRARAARYRLTFGA